MSPPATWNAKKPRAHRTNSTNAIVKSMVLSPYERGASLPRGSLFHARDLLLRLADVLLGLASELLAEIALDGSGHLVDLPLGLFPGALGDVPVSVLSDSHGVPPCAVGTAELTTNNAFPSARLGPGWSSPGWAPGSAAFFPPRPGGLAASTLRIGGRAVNGGERHVVQPQVDAELAAVVDDVVDHERADHRGARQGEDDLLAVAQRPVDPHVRIGDRGEGLARRLDVRVEQLEQLGGGGVMGRVVGYGRTDVELGLLSGRRQPARLLGDVICEAAQRQGLRGRR